jgi:DNA repair protein RadD
LNFNNFKSRFDDTFIQSLLGESALQLVQLLDPNLVTRSNLLDLALDYHTPQGLLLDKAILPQLFDFLTPVEAERLAVILGLDVSSDDPYNLLKKTSIYRGTPREEKIFNFFGLTAPLIHEVEPSPAVENTKASYPLFSHQREAARSIQQYLNSDHRRVLLHMPTGSGKTRTAMNIIAEHIRRYEPTLVIWLAHSQELCEQAATEFQDAWNYLGNRHLNVYRYWENREIDLEEIEDGFVVAGLDKTYQSAKRDVEFITTLGRKCSLVIIDEAHSAVAETYQLVLQSLVVQRRQTSLLGLTATPGRTWLDMDADEELAKFFYHQKVSLEVEGYKNPVDYLVDEGYLAAAHFIPLFYESGNRLSDADLRQIESKLDIPPRILKTLAEDEQRNLRIITEVERLVETHKRIIIFASTVKHSNLLASVLTLRGYDAKSITSDTSARERERNIERYKEKTKDARILCNYGVLTTGFDAPQTSAALIARPTKSLVLYSQMVGRAIRGKRAGGNATAEIVTVVDQQLPGFRSVAEAFNHWEDIWE